jgi:hypothetical protein
MNEQLILFCGNPLVALYGLQALIYAVAAIRSRHAGHRDLCACYWFSATIHAALAAYHLSHFG